MNERRAPTFDALVWEFDPAASGSRRRAFIDASIGEPAELIAYSDGTWYLRLPQRRYPSGANGAERDLAAAQRRVFRVWVAMTSEDAAS